MNQFVHVYQTEIDFRESKYSTHSVRGVLDDEFDVNTETDGAQSMCWVIIYHFTKVASWAEHCYCQVRLNQRSQPVSNANTH